MMQLENMVVIEALKCRYNQGKEAGLYYLRDNNGNEVDIVFAQGRKLVPIEIKSALTFNNSFLKGINYFQRLTENSADGVIIYGGDLCPIFERAQVINFLETYTIFK
jgi:predicted AAA+ superfamily ATPase